MLHTKVQCLPYILEYLSLLGVSLVLSIQISLLLFGSSLLTCVSAKPIPRPLKSTNSCISHSCTNGFSPDIIPFISLSSSLHWSVHINSVSFLRRDLMLGRSCVMSGMKFLKELSIPSRLCTLATIVGWLSSVMALAFNGAGFYNPSPPPISIPV